MQFNDTSTYNGHIQAIERYVYSSDYGRVSGNSTELANWTIRLNQALNRTSLLMSEYANNWRVGDWNTGSYDTATENIVSGTREVKITNPEDVMFIFSVLIKQDATTTDYREIKPFDIRDRTTLGYVENDAQNVGIPWRYEKAGGYISLDPTPNYSATNGLKYYYQKVPHMFLVGDTTAEAGVPSVFEEIVHLYAIDQHATEDSNVTLKSLVQSDIARVERDIKNFMSMRSASDQMPRLKPVNRSSR